jgi:hypothetical protein
MTKTIIFLLILLISSVVKADYVSWNELQTQFNKVSKNPKALSHVKCFFEKHEKDHFQLKAPTCYAKPVIGLDSTRFFAIVDYMVNSDQQRMFLIDRKTGKISKMAVAHGRYKAGFFNTKLEDQKNSIKEIKYYSNEINSMASSSGFFIGGQDFAASDFGRSLVIHGLEGGINDNACERDVVIHKHFLMTKSKAYMLSSGCLMVSPKLIDNVIDLLKGTADEEMRLQTSGSLVFIYSPREAAWSESSCPGNFSIASEGPSQDRP